MWGTSKVVYAKTEPSKGGQPVPFLQGFMLLGSWQTWLTEVGQGGQTLPGFGLRVKGHFQTLRANCAVGTLREGMALPIKLFLKN